MGGGINVGHARHHAAWHSEPEFRGTYGLLTSCFLTMILCVWTAVHLNVPEHKKAKAQVWKKIWWLVIGLFAPELVAWVAFEQYKEARAVNKRIKETLGEGIQGSWFQRAWWRNRRKRRKSRPGIDRVVITEEQSEQVRSPRKHAWTMTHSYYAIMGGFAFDSDIAKQDFLPDGRKRVALTSIGVIDLAISTPHLLPDLSISQITDKSKASSLAKTIVCFQASWFVAQCISRMATGLSISLLELNTFAHALCTLLTYSLWWHKPLDVEEPTLIDGTDVDIVTAGMCMRSPLGTKCDASDFLADKQMIGHLWFEQHGVRDKRDCGLVQSLHWNIVNKSIYLAVEPQEGMPATQTRSVVQGKQTIGLENAAQGSNLSKSTTNPRRLRLYMGHSLYGFGFRRGDYSKFDHSPRRKSLRRAFTGRSSIASEVSIYGFKSLQLPWIELTAIDIQRLRLAQQCYQKYPSLFRSTYNTGHPYYSAAAYLGEYVVSSVRNWPPYSLSRFHDGHFDGWHTTLAFSFAGIAYGGLHLLAWHPPVATRAQVLMWRISGITLAGTGILLILGEFFDMVEEVNGKAKHASIVGKLVSISGLLEKFMGAVYLLAICLYMFSRIYLPVECVISIPFLPDSTFETIKWSHYFPHLS